MSPAPFNKNKETVGEEAENFLMFKWYALHVWIKKVSELGQQSVSHQVELANRDPIVSSYQFTTQNAQYSFQVLDEESAGVRCNLET